MTKEEILQALENASSTVGILSDDAKEAIANFIEDKKAELDTETRREVRKFWIAISVVTFLLGVAIGYGI